MSEELERVKVTIERSRWLRGEGASGSRLLRSKDGKMCCLGFAALALGRTEDQIRDQDSPTTGEFTDDGSKLAGAGTRLVVALAEPHQVGKAMLVNDDRDTTDAFKEEQLTKLLSEIGLDLEFVP